MGNCNYLITRGNITWERFDRTLREVVKLRFGKVLQVHTHSDQELRGWTLRHPVPEVRLPVFQVWMDSRRSFEFDPRLHPINHFFESCVRHDLAKALGGKLHYDAVGGRFDPEPEKYTTYKKYVLDMYESTDPTGSIYSLEEAERFRFLFKGDLSPWFE